MDQSNWKRAFALIVAVLLIAAFGCGKVAYDSKTGAEVATEVVSLDSGDSSNAETAAVEPSGIYSVDGVEDESASGSYASSAENETVVLVQNAGQFIMSSADINKTGDAQGDFSNGINAALAVISQGQMTLTDSNVTTNALGGFGCYVSGAGSVLTVADSYVYTSGDSSPAIVAADGGAVSVTGGIFSTEGMDSPCILLGGGSVTLSSVTVKAAGGEVLRVLSGSNALTLDATSISASPILGAGSTLLLKLQNGASFTGELGAELPAKVSVTLDATSTLSLSADAYVTALVNADATHQNIQSNGFSLYYDSNAAENAYLSSQSYLLPGGGFLSPII